MSNHVRIWEEKVVIPTYPVKEPDRNPMFLEKRVNQGTSGRTYPIPVISRLSDEKIDRSYQAVWIENEWVRVMVLPELGGRIFVGEDKTNGYNFFYRQSVIKPALIGLTGPWISGGVEFNWPQHHRPTTFSPVDHWVEEHEDGSKTVWMGEIEPLYQMKGMVGVTLHPGKSIVEARVQLFNRTPFPHPFMWWANVAVKINDQYQAFFPTDVHYVTDHARRAMSAFPIARANYYGVDYSKGVDITWTKNMKSAGSYFVMNTDYDFFGGYDHQRQAGVVHVANRFIAPGKKMFNWGDWEAGHRWQRNLTDVDGEYVELMAGVYTDNQPDFSWMQPYEMRQFSQYWYPIQAIGPVQNATLEAAVSLEVKDGFAHVGVHSPESRPGSSLVLRSGDQTLWDTRTDLAPDRPFVKELELPSNLKPEEVILYVYDLDGRELLHYTPPEPVKVTIPEAFKPAPLPTEIAHNEELYLTGLHLEQYRHPTRDPQPYYEEALRRDPGDARCNNALGLLLLRRGQFTMAAEFFQKAVERQTRYNPNPYDGEPYYNLGLTLKWLDRRDEAYKAFYKATWNQAWAAAGYLSLAQLDCASRNWDTALQHLEQSLIHHNQNLSALNLKAAVLRQLNRAQDALDSASATRQLDLLDYGARWERSRALKALDHQPEAYQELEELKSLMTGNAQSWIELAHDYTQAGMYEEACLVLDQAVYSANRSKQAVHPMVYYLLAFNSELIGDHAKANSYCDLAASMPPDLCFPARLEEMQALESALRRNPQDARAPYYLGNLLYDKQRHAEALECWEKSRMLNPDFATLQRNLALAYFNDLRDPERARQALAYAFKLDPHDPRILLELVMLLEQLKTPALERLVLLEAHLDTVSLRDDLYLEYITLLNATGQYRRASELIGKHVFHPWEGGEGAVSRQYIWSHLAIGINLLQKGKVDAAIQELNQAMEQPESLGEGRGWGHPQTNLYYFMGKALQKDGQKKEAQGWFEKAYQTHPWGAGEFTFFKGLAALEIDRKNDAKKIFKKMKEAAKAIKDTKPQTPYFAASLPLFLRLEADQEERQLKQFHLLMGLANAGLGMKKKAHKHLKLALPLPQDPNLIQIVLEELLK